MLTESNCRRRPVGILVIDVIVSINVYTVLIRTITVELLSVFTLNRFFNCGPRQCASLLG